MIFLFLFFSPKDKGRTARVNSSVVVQAFNQRAWKILFTRSRTPHSSPLYVPICLFTPAHAAPLHTRPTIDSSISSDASSFLFLSLLFLSDWIEISNLSDRTRISIKIRLLIFWETCFETRGGILERGEKESFNWFGKVYFITNKIRWNLVEIFEWKRRDKKLC